MAAVESTHDSDHLRHGTNLGDGNRIRNLRRLLYRGLGRLGAGAALASVELVIAFGTGFCPGSLDPCLALWALLLSAS